METDSSNWVMAGVLSQLDKESNLQPVAFFLKTLKGAECNYEIYNKELLAIMTAFDIWCPELKGVAHQVKVLTDHKNLEYFMTTR